ncbi:hypothetical protein [Herbaspirillum huttiense]|uniref:hypothetical protein n=1 Tax=Herbaspirillum huttiense TaxID=863372 RepID=UPI002E7837E7|nr:hypothetical protein [Herbaspirillum huttiense]MEE1636337.1 hypothetical protein [Herbaspirillum huttiense NC40101]
MKLVATQAFGGYAQGAEITDKTAIDAILASEQANFVVRVPDDAAPAPIPAASIKNAVATDTADSK